MNISSTDLKALVRLLTDGAALIDRYTVIPREADKARRMRQMVKKLKRKEKKNDLVSKPVQKDMRTSPATSKPKSDGSLEAGG